MSVKDHPTIPAWKADAVVEMVHGWLDDPYYDGSIDTRKLERASNLLKELIADVGALLRAKEEKP